MKNVIISLISLFIFLIINKIIIVALKRKSLIYKRIEQINNYYYFYDVPNKIIIDEYLNSKIKVLKYDFTTKIISLINDNQDNLLIYIQDIYHNRKYYKMYQKEYVSILSNTNYIIKRLCKKIKLKPNINIKVKLKVSYKKYKIYNIYDYDDLLLLVKKLKNIKLRKELKRKFMKLERNKLNDGLRYDIFKRDNFRCQICGSNASDNVKLHVDHIIPISKGGKTEYSNLQTLCERCNFGKSDKI